MDEQLYYKQFLLPPISFDSRDFSFTKLAIQEAQDIRKNETDAIVPHLPTIRAEPNLRWNQMKKTKRCISATNKDCRSRFNIIAY
ncbi:hypothetical protein MHI22_03305 [Lysinibacillus sp. FSL L8-0312]|uniref:hypothetical protein n=1 Tax=Lysinibacillus sp. FSL L8-0312 TaxID=2921521 RepID=UPI0030F853AD